MPIEKSDLSVQARAGYYTSNLFMRGVIGAALALPYHVRVPAMGWLASRVLAPLVGFRKRIRSNLQLARPDLGVDEVERLCRAVPDNAGRMIIEYYSTKPFTARAARATTSGPGWDAVDEARAKGQPVIICTAHFGNYEAIRVTLKERGHEMGVLYRRMANPYFNEHYVRKLAALGEPTFEQGGAG